jgi:hypothetical protein
MFVKSSQQFEKIVLTEAIFFQLSPGTAPMWIVNDGSIGQEIISEPKFQRLTGNNGIVPELLRVKAVQVRTAQEFRREEGTAKTDIVPGGEDCSLPSPGIKVGVVDRPVLVGGHGRNKADISPVACNITKLLEGIGAYYDIRLYDAKSCIGFESSLPFPS